MTPITRVIDRIFEQQGIGATTMRVVTLLASHLSFRDGVCACLVDLCSGFTVAPEAEFRLGW